MSDAGSPPKTTAKEWPKGQLGYDPASNAVHIRHYSCCPCVTGPAPFFEMRSPIADASPSLLQR